MPLIGENMEDHQIAGGTFNFSAKRVEDLGATEYTLAVITFDRSGSVDSFRAEIEKCVKEVVDACRQSPRADNLMLKLDGFDNSLEEIHGFKPLSECNKDDYTNIVQIGGMTALYDAACSAVEATRTYGKTLTENDFDVNAIVVVITDGMDNRSAMTPKSIKQALEGVVQDEALESILSILVGVNIQNQQVSNYLKGLQRDAGFTQYVELDKADAKTLAKLADFVSRSISAQSQALGTGGPSQSLNF